ncbi:unnamed protein product [Chilo suppressalis]|uniref:Uncharacterized protein n=1 Tax=Chilo suppressalis TaxID=168631 RepID=A0ABN8ARA1_CHISP|nr:unnamed protein product [Chilo suppressalis]
MNKLSSLKNLMMLLKKAKKKASKSDMKKTREKGEKQDKTAVAKNLLKAGVSIDFIAESAGLPKAQKRKSRERAFYANNVWYPQLSTPGSLSLVCGSNQAIRCYI